MLEPYYKFIEVTNNEEGKADENADNIIHVVPNSKIIDFNQKVCYLSPITFRLWEFTRSQHTNFRLLVQNVINYFSLRLQ